jgi:3-oxoacyl-[acyl-carrier protein] reductase
MDLGLKDKVALVAAASKGLGYGVARALAKEGARVSICSREEGAIQQAAERLRKDTGAEVLPVACDVRDAASILQWVDQTVKQWGRIDALLVNAGGPPAGAFKSFSDEQWQAAFELTLLSTVRMIRAVLPHMTEGSAILTVTSASVVEPVDNLILSTTLRSGVTGLVKSLSDELAPDGIRVNNILPGRIDTDRVAHLNQTNAQKQGVSVEEVVKQSVSRIPLKRMGTIDEFGAAAAFLLSPAASYITGEIVRLDGGVIRSIH